MVKKSGKKQAPVHITDSASLHDIKAELEHLNETSTHYVLSSETEKAILTKITHECENSEDISTLLNSLVLVALIRLSTATASDIFHQTLEILLQQIKQKCSAFSPFSYSFFQAYQQNAFIARLRQTNKLFDIKCQMLDNIAHEIIETQANMEKERSQNYYANLLTSILEKDNSALPLTFLNPYGNTTSSQRTFLPETEYPPPTAEPENPDEIGISKTMNFNPSDVSGILEKFSTTSLIGIFNTAFPWSINFDETERLSATASSHKENLLGINMVLSASLQFSLIQTILTCLDILGKLCGSTGERSLENAMQITEISNTLKTLSNTLDKLDANTLPALEQSLIRQRKKLALQNTLLVNSSKNTIMNDFCHLNESWSAENLNIATFSTLLVPQKPSKKLLTRKKKSKKI